SRNVISEHAKRTPSNFRLLLTHLSMQSRHNFEYMLAGLLFLLLVAPAIRQAAPQAALVLQPTAFGVA
ncbi:MAG: hypothetical protein GTN85_03420, partial [Pseudomonas stutzeri]|nr:hypothetical protein [Stutzerimonas stutzeri]NIS58637.1 hypothetical protein [Stutzerimonas stutzeri]